MMPTGSYDLMIRNCATQLKTAITSLRRRSGPKFYQLSRRRFARSGQGLVVLVVASLLFVKDISGLVDIEMISPNNGVPIVTRKPFGPDAKPTGEV